MHIADRIFNLIKKAERQDIEPKYLYIGSNEYLELRNSLESSSLININTNTGIVYFCSLEIIKVQRRNHLNVGG